MATGSALVWRAAARPGSAERAFAAVNAVGVAAVVAHLTAWPSRRAALGVPWLTSCEGLGRTLMPTYNALLYTEGITALAALAAENRSVPLAFALLVAPFVPVLGAMQHREHERLHAIAAARPTW